MTRRYGQPPRQDIRYRHRPGVYAILPRAGRMLVTHQAAPEPEFQLPGGGIDAGESPLQALHREVMEETGWIIATPLRLGAFRRFVYMPDYDIWAEKICLIFRARPVRALRAPSEQGHSAHWMAPDRAARMLGNPGDRDFVARSVCRAK